MRIVYFIQNPLNTRDIERFGISCALDRGHRVTIVDVTRIVFPWKKSGDENPPGLASCSIHAVNTHRELTRLWAGLGPFDLAMAMIQSNGHTQGNWRILRLISRAKIPYLILSCFHYPGWDQEWANRSLLGRVRGVLQNSGWFAPLNSLIARIPPRWLGIEPAAYVVFSGEASMTPNPLVAENTAKIFAHSPDYEIFRKIRPGRPASESLGPYAVFLDQFSPLHPDLRDKNDQDKLDPAVYFACINNLFDRIEKELGIPVVIAAHPRADYRSMPKIFNGRKIVYNATAETVLHSRLVLAHDSISIGFAVMAHKPVIPIVYRARYTLHAWGAYVTDAFCRALDKQPQILEDWQTADLSEAFAINEDAYASYMRAFVKIPGTPEQPFWDIVFDSVSPPLNRAMRVILTQTTVPIP